MFPVGIDVSKNTLDLCMLYDGIKGRIKTRNIQNNRHSVENILRWLRLQHCSPEDVHVVMEATGVYHERLATLNYIRLLAGLRGGFQKGIAAWRLRPTRPPKPPRYDP